MNSNINRFSSIQKTVHPICAICHGAVSGQQMDINGEGVRIDSSNVHDVLIVSHLPKTHLECIQANYELNPNSIGPPTQYLGADVWRVTRPGDPLGKKDSFFSAAPM